MNGTHDDIAELLGAYALDAVDPDEAELVEAHLRECPRCTAEVAEHREVAAMLAHSGAPAPEGLWTQISASLEEPPPELDLPLGGRSTGTVVDLDERRRTSLTCWLPVGAAAAAVLVVVGLVAGLVIADDGPGDPSQVAAPALEDIALRVLDDPTARQATLAGEEGDLAAAVAIDADGSGYLLGETLPTLDDDRTYQLWGVSDRVIVSLGVLGSSPGVVAFHVDEGIHTLVITEEEAGGVPSSSNPPFLAGEIS
jgi:anti-sigma-K factor RskA